MKSNERNLLDEKTLRHNQEFIEKQLTRFLDFDKTSPAPAELVNNYDWTKDYSFLNFIRDIGKHITVNYMMAKDSVKKRLSGELNEGMSFTEFSYQLLQAWDFLYLYQTKNCKLQMGGSDQWGNITTGTELIRRIARAEAFGLTCPLITKADGGKFGKTEEGNIWLDPERTSPYEFYKFWRNVCDDDVRRFMLLYTLLPVDEVERLSDVKGSALNKAKKVLAFEVTKLIHGETAAQEAAILSKDLFEGGGNAASVPTTFISEDDLQTGLSVIDALVLSGLSSSKTDARRLVQQNGLSVNEVRVTDPEHKLFCSNLVDGRILLRKGKKDFHALKLDE
jgi:tyrosyl-tRNA synthetase